MITNENLIVVSKLLLLIIPVKQFASLRVPVPAYVVYHYVVHTPLDGWSDEQKCAI